MNIEEITRLRSSLAYKHYGIPWLKDVPDHWNVPRLKTHLVLNDSGVWSEEPDDRGTTVLRSTEQTIDGHWNIKNPARLRIGERERDVATLVTGDLIITKSSGSSAHIGKTTLVDDEVSSLRCCFSNFMQRVRTGDGVRPRFLWYYLNSYIGREQLLARATTTTGLANLNGRIIGNARIPIPPPHEQYTIVRYLDGADQRIRAYVSVKERLIALLEEERRAAIHQAVTRGLDPNVKLKPSGVEWLGDVPEHWVTCRIKQVSGILRGKFTHRPRNDPSLYDGPYPFIQTGDIASTNKILSGYNQTLNENGFAVSKMFPKGTLVMTIAANIGDVAVLDFDACFPDSVVGFVPTVRVDRDYLYYLFLAMKNELLREAPVNTQGNLNVDRIGSSTIALPQKEEQTNIVNHVERSVSNIDAAIDLARRQIELMEEYRTRLIADVVTGKLDVRESPQENP